MDDHTEYSKTDAQPSSVSEMNAEHPNALTSDVHSIGLEDLPVQLEVCLAEIEVSLAKFRTLKAGITVPLNVSLTGRMDISVNGANFGSGTLVQIGDRIGIQIQKWQAEPEH